MHPSASPSPDLAVWAEGLGRRFGERWAVRDLSLELRGGEVFGLLERYEKLLASRNLAGLVGALCGPALLAIVSAPDSLAATFLLGPAIALLSVVLGVLVGSRANDPRTAQQIGAVIVVPRR